jgi:hypothetical protein
MYSEKFISLLNQVAKHYDYTILEIVRTESHNKFDKDFQLSIMTKVKHKDGYTSGFGIGIEMFWNDNTESFEMYAGEGSYSIKIDNPQEYIADLQTALNLNTLLGLSDHTFYIRATEESNERENRLMKVREEHLEEIINLEKRYSDLMRGKISFEQAREDWEKEKENNTLPF